MKVSWPISSILTIKLVAMATFLIDLKKMIKPVIYHEIPTNDKHLVKIGLLDPEIICPIMYFEEKTTGCTPFTLLNSGVTGPTFTRSS